VIPDLGIIVAVYAIFQCAAEMCRPHAAFESNGHRVFVRIFGLACILAIVFLAIDLIAEGAALSAVPTRGVFPQPH
jgi:hypothetical protein